MATMPLLRGQPSFAPIAPSLARVAIAMGDRALAESLAIGADATTPYQAHTGVATRAALTEGRGDLEAAAEAYGDAAERWAGFGVVAEQAFALLGRGRCLLGLSRPGEASPPLHEARAILERLGAAPALAEVDGLLERDHRENHSG
jgi:hypothetical protein